MPTYFGKGLDTYLPRFLEYLRTKNWARRDIGNLEKDVEAVYAQMEKMHGKSSFQGRGLVMGDIQSGKTSFYTGLAAKALDDGYKLIIVLTSNLSALRDQTQERLDECLAGYSTKEEDELIGVGEMEDYALNEEDQVVQVTGVGYDFNPNENKYIDEWYESVTDDSPPSLIVVKKESNILKKLSQYMQDWAGYDGGKMDLPVLLIDDEADSASITGADSDSPGTIEKEIRQILWCFSKVWYIGVTATPYANLFDGPKSEKKDLACGLYPKDLVYYISHGSKYFGLQEMTKDEDAESYFITSEETAEKADTFIQRLNNLVKRDNRGRGRPPKDIEKNFSMPSEMRDALRYFFLLIAIADIEGIKIPMTMLINFEHENKPQNKFYEKIQESIQRELTAVQNDTGYKDEGKNKGYMSIFKDYLQPLLKEEFDGPLGEYSPMSVYRHLRKMIKDKTPRKFLEIHCLNSETSKEINRIEYDEYDEEEPFRGIVIGGYKLSRGMTFKGLYVTYFYRDTTTADTLFQMARWCGYPNKDYASYCKIWTTPEILKRFKASVKMFEELKKQFVDLSRKTALLADPVRIGQYAHELRISKYKEIIPTAKMNGANPKLKENVPGVAQTYGVWMDEESISNQRDEILEKLKSLPICPDATKYGCPKNTLFWKNISPEVIREIYDCSLENDVSWYDEEAQEMIESYLEKCEDEGQNWDIVIPQGEGELYNIDIDESTSACIRLTSRRKLSIDTRKIARSRYEYYTFTNDPLISGETMRFGLTVQKAKSQKDLYEEQSELNDGWDYSENDCYLASPGRNPLLVIFLVEAGVEDEPVLNDPLMAFAFCRPGELVEEPMEWRV